MVSVIVPIYNVEEYLEECLESIAAQTFDDFEVVMVDDGSTDRSTDICNEWIAVDHRFKLFTKKNGGHASARNFGLKASTGNYVTFIDSDDVVHPDYLKVLMQIANRSEYFISGVGMMRFHDELPVVSGVVRHFYHYLPYDAIKEMLYQTGPFINSVWGKLFNRELICDIWFRDGILYEDLEWITRVLENMPKSKRIGISDASLYFYRRRYGSAMDTFSDGTLDVLQVTSEIEQRMEYRVHKNNTASSERELLRAARDRRLSANFDLFMQLYGRKDYEQYLIECWNQILRLRMNSLINPSVRKKNKFGIILSFFGKTLCGKIGSVFINRLKK